MQNNPKQHAEQDVKQLQRDAEQSQRHKATTKRSKANKLNDQFREAKQPQRDTKTIPIRRKANRL